MWKRAVLAVACLAACGLAAAQDQVATTVEVGRRVEPDGSVSVLRATTDGGRILLRVGDGGDLVLRWGAVVDFNGITFRRAGGRAGYLLVLVDGTPYLLPLMELHPEDRAMVDEDRVRAEER